MLQLEIDRAVSRVTGESRRIIARHGFSMERPPTDGADSLSLGLDCPGCGRPAQIRLDSIAKRMSEAECAHCDAVYDAEPCEMFILDRDGPPAVPA